MPEISVVVPVYNVELYLKKCITSIINQTYTDFELILVDDGSTDACPQICDAYAQSDNRIAVIHKKNGGLSDARNAAIDVAKGNYITFIDSDDWVMPNYLEVLHCAMISSGGDIVVGNLHKEYDDHSDSSYDVKAGVFTNEQAVAELCVCTPFTIYGNVACGKLYRLSLFQDIRYPFGRLHEDGFTTYKLYYKAGKVVTLSDDLYCYYQRSNSIMGSFSENNTDEYCVYKEREQFFEEKHFPEHVVVENRKVILTCAKSLSIKMLNSDTIAKEVCKKWLDIFYGDFKERKEFYRRYLSKKNYLKSILFFPIVCGLVIVRKGQTNCK